MFSHFMLLVAANVRCHWIDLLKLVPMTPAASFNPRVSEAIGSEEEK